ncbi:polysaccharide biosynthesis C-terminal domain-containing protein [Bacteroidota bacterium]
MIKKIIGTTGAKFFNAILAFLIVLLNTNYLGAEGYGTISLIILNIAIVLIFNDLIAGPIVYFASRIELLKLIIPAYLWALLTATVITIILYFIRQISPFIIHVFALSFIFSMSSFNMNYLLGRERIAIYNTINVLQISLIILALLFFFLIMKEISILSYLYSLYTGYILTFLLSFIFILKYLRIVSLKEIFADIKRILNFGFYSQSANIFQLLNRRLSYYYIEFLLPNGRFLLGIFSAGVRLSESIWMVGQSVSLVQFARISNTKDMEYARKITLSLLKFTFCFTLFILVVLLLLPAYFYIFLFGEDFTHVKVVIVSLSIGILSIAVSMMFSHYFSGTGRPKYNMYSSLTAFVFTVFLGYIFIPRYGLVGAGLVASFSYICATIFQMVIFLKLTKTRLREFLIHKEDIRLIKSIFSNLRNKSK